jgi:hypothetical protein
VPSFGSTDALQSVDGFIGAGLCWLGKAALGAEGAFGAVGGVGGLLTPAPGPLGVIVPAPGPGAAPPPAASAVEPANRLPSTMIESAVLRIVVSFSEGQREINQKGFSFATG